MDPTETLVFRCANLKESPAEEKTESSGDEIVIAGITENQVYETCKALAQGYEEDFRLCLSALTSGKGTTMRQIATDANSTVQALAEKHGISLIKPDVKPKEPTEEVVAIHHSLRPSYVSTLAEFLEVNQDTVTEQNGGVQIAKALRTKHQSATTAATVLFDHLDSDFDTDAEIYTP